MGYIYFTCNYTIMYSSNSFHLYSLPLLINYLYRNAKHTIVVVY